MKIKVKRNHINDGTPCEPAICPVALAICDALDTRNIRVGYRKIKVANAKIDTPKSVKNFITTFDKLKDGESRRRLKAFEFEL